MCILQQDVSRELETSESTGSFKGTLTGSLIGILMGSSIDPEVFDGKFKREYAGKSWLVDFIISS